MELVVNKLIKKNPFHSVYPAVNDKRPCGRLNTGSVYPYEVYNKQ
jgi:hypothetical protein